jgi:hypothetical protein
VVRVGTSLRRLAAAGAVVVGFLLPACGRGDDDGGTKTNGGSDSPTETSDDTSSDSPTGTSDDTSSGTRIETSESTDELSP